MELYGKKEWARDMWMFLYLANGMNPMDMAKLKWENIKEDHIVSQRSKTGKPIIVILLSQIVISS